MNNYAEIVFGPKDKQGLIFGQVALEEFDRLVAQQQSTSATIAAFNFIYCGAVNFNALNFKPAPNYADLYEKFEAWQDNAENSKAYEQIAQTYLDSRFGKGVEKLTEAYKKKADELLKENQLTGEPLDALPTES